MPHPQPGWDQTTLSQPFYLICLLIPGNLGIWLFPRVVKGTSCCPEVMGRKGLSPPGLPQPCCGSGGQFRVSGPNFRGIV